MTWIVSRPNHSPDRTTATIDEDFGDDHMAAAERVAELERKNCHWVVCWRLDDFTGPWRALSEEGAPR